MKNPSPTPYRGNNPLIGKLSRFVPLTEGERGALEHLCRNPRRHRAGNDLIQEGEKPVAVFVVLKGWAYRYKQLADGSRQIMAFLIPGDLCDVQIFLFERMDHSIGLFSDAEIVKIPAREILELMDRCPRIERALTWATLVDESTLREWLLNVGQRSALQRIAHLFCELFVRLSVIGLVDEHGSFDMPLKQTDLADTTGITPVHTNRTLQKLRQDGLITTRRGQLRILDFDKLAKIAGFNPVYLHTDGPPVEPRLEHYRRAS